MKTRNVLLAIMAGLAAGAIAGILYAPHKGSKTRKNILNKGEEYSDAIKNKLDDLTKTINSKIESGKHFTESLISNGKERHDGAKTDLKNATT